jgi:hypothetical protein
LDSEYVISGPNRWEANIFLDGEQVAKIRKGKDLTLKLVDNRDGHEWILTNKVHGQIRPFSVSIVEEEHKGKEEGSGELFTIREHVFKHKDKFYMLTNHPEGRPWHDYLGGTRYICRLDNFPYKDLKEIDNLTKHKLRRFRGVPVGEATGLGVHDGHRVKINKELGDIGLFIAASSYLIYSTA